jgi:hypothetical protein
LKFVSSVAKDEIVDESTLKSFEGFKDRTFFSKNTTFRKGILACLLEVQAYRDSIELADIPKQSGLKIVPHQAKSHEVVIVDGSRVAESGGSSVYGYPRQLDSVVKCGRVNKDWYLLWQVLYIVNCFSEEFLGKKRNGEDILSLERLCNHIGVDHAKAQAVVDMGIDMKEYSIMFVGQKATSRPRRMCHRAFAATIQCSIVVPATVNLTYMRQSKEDLEEEPNVQATREEPPTKIQKKKQKSGGNSNGRTGPNLSEKDSIEYVCPICIEEQCKNVKRFRFPHGEFVKDGKVIMDKKWGQTGKYRSATQKARSHHKKVHPHVSMPVAYAITQMKHHKVDP